MPAPGREEKHALADMRPADDSRGMIPTLRTDRLLLRPWRDDDRAAFAAINADPEVMRHFPAPLTRAGSDAMIDRALEKWAVQGFGFWAVALADGPFIGFVGLNRPVNEPQLRGLVEIGWRLSRAHWGRGYATEAARAALAFGFALGMQEIVAFTAQGNVRSRRVMEKLGMTHDPADDFPADGLDADHPLARQVLYRLRSEAFSPSRPAC